MNRNILKGLSALAAFAFALAVVPIASAQCGLSYKAIKPMSFDLMPKAPSLLRVSSGPSIVGMWHVKFIAQTMNGSAIPEATIDDAISQWHSDGTEIMNSARPPQDSNFCLGIYEQTGPDTYYLNHIPWRGNDTTNADTNGIGNPSAGTQILEKVTLAHNGKSFSGTFRLTAYKADGTVAVCFTGVLAGTRITPSTSFQSLL